MLGCMSHRSFLNLNLLLFVSIGWVAFLAGCSYAPAGTTGTILTPSQLETSVSPPENPEQPYLFYLHGKIIEDQGLPAVSPDFGVYEYQAILEALANHGFEVVSEVRPANTDGVVYARKIAEQVATLLDSGVPPAAITIVGASKGAGIAILVSNFLENPEINFVLMSICNPENVQSMVVSEIRLYGNVLSIYDRGDPMAGSCQDLFHASEGGGLSRYAEIELQLGLGHGILYRPLDEWVIPAVEWARGGTP